MFTVSASANHLLTRKEAAAHLSSLGYPVSQETLRRLASEGAGPPHIKFLQRIVRYDRTALERWAESRTTRIEGDDAA